VISQPTRFGVRKLDFLPSGQVAAIQRGAATATIRYDAFGDVQALDVVGQATETRSDRRYGLIEQREVIDEGRTMQMRSFPIGNAVATRRGPNDEWTIPVGEQRGNRFFVDQDGKLVQEDDYLPFGELALTDGAKPTSRLYTREQWNGGDNLDAFGISQLGARFYDPVIGRFLSPDLLVQMNGAGGSNPYAFAINDPVNLSDPSGLCVEGGCTSGNQGTDVGNPLIGGREVSPRPPAPPKFAAGANSIEHMVGVGATTDMDPIQLARYELMLFRAGLEQYRIDRSNAELARMCETMPRSCDSTIEKGPVADAARELIGYIIPPISPPSYYLRQSDSRVLQLNPQSGVEYFRVRDEQNAAAAFVAAGRFNDRVQQVFSGAMELAGGMIRFGLGGMLKGGPSGVPVPVTAPPSGSECFSADTPVLIEAGSKPISEIRAGERVWSFVDARGEWGWHAVTDVLVHRHSGPMVVIQSGDGRIVATPNHPICVGAGAGLESRVVPDDIGGDPVRCGSGGRWVMAGNLRDGDVALGARGGALVVRADTGEHSRLVYNLQVEEGHSYVVGAAALLVHNKPMPIRADTVAESLGFERTNDRSHGQPVFRKGNLYISRDIGTAGAAAGDNPFVVGHNGGYWKMATGSPKNLGSKGKRMGTYDMMLGVKLGD
jgi:RHS repeat-associated protein